ncbi:hypothetical protein PAAG_05137 [Paracoccidioides lutzii Pb01]|uniref:Uncharacterized protein n=1 Tax=Paracoccidioides lutzii (strain ATCC MYA-826 / Pb01) TaxID=502779 RepID=C1H2Z4_PARBA|nr:hypothetical protein PAAG_05137 [Paracoccidioides lutzii Pb01]EEH34088.2 hypothetical protein PAAG_05137 [Paracoccidioides lutzii Pb01]
MPWRRNTTNPNAGVSTAQVYRPRAEQPSIFCLVTKISRFPPFDDSFRGDEPRANEPMHLAEVKRGCVPLPSLPSRCRSRATERLAVKSS